MSKRSVKQNIIVLSIVLPLLVAGIFSVFMYIIQANSFGDKEKELLLAEGISSAMEVKSEMIKSFELLRNLAADPETAEVLKRLDQVPDGLDNDDFIELEGAAELSKRMEYAIKWTDIDLVFASGTKTTGILLGRDVQIGEGFDVRKRDYYDGALAYPGEPFISQPRVSAEQGAAPKIVITVALGVTDESGNAAGILALNYQLDPIIRILKTVMESTGKTIGIYDRVGGFFIWNPNGEEEYFFDPENMLTLESIAVILGFKEADIAEFVNHVSTDFSYFFQGTTPFGKSLINSFQIPGTRWGLFISTPISEITKIVTGSVLPPILAFIAGLLILQIVVYLIYSRLMIKPLIEMGSNLANLAAADADLTVEMPVLTKDEIGGMAKNFNEFVLKLCTLMNDLKGVIGNTFLIKQNVVASAEETSTAIEEISANLESISGQIDILDNNINETVAAIEQVTRNISSVDEQIISQSSMVEQSTAAITQMMASLGSVNHVAQNKKQTTVALAAVASDGRTKIEETASAFKSVVEHINQIQEMASAINGIAAQTNLLSMNAAIEAAHAGDSGKGFAVVAEEIRKLADSAGNSAKAISKSIKDITSSVLETDKNVAETTQAFDRISAEVDDTVNAFSEIEQSVSELNIGGQQILESTNQINEVTLSIRSGSAEIKSGTSLMQNSSMQIKEVSSRVSTGMAESNTGAREIVRAMQQMVDFSQELGDIVEELKDNFGQFKTDKTEET